MRSHSRVTGTLRLLVSLWLMGSAVWTLADPIQAVQQQGMPMTALLPLAGLSFAVGVFLLTGFMTRALGLVLVGMGVWQLASFGFALAAPLLIAVGVYFALRGGGAWAMDIYVQKMQDRVRQKAVNSPESS
jgi:uncharacterized membrane protein YphA (DoxX/SURF4 family)